MDKPLILNLKKPRDFKIFLSIKRKNKSTIIDNYLLMIKEYYASFKRKNKSHLSTNIKDNIKSGLWIYYPWYNTFIHIIDRQRFYQLRVSRNKELITQQEQNIIKKSLVGLAGLNIGNPVALALTFQGFLNFKISDKDILELSNLNRLAAGFRIVDLYKEKSYLTARQIYDIDPFAKIDVFQEGLGDDNLEKFLLKPRLDLLIEEMDNLQLKIKIRELAKKYCIPVIMATGNESDIILDIERYDLNPNLKILNGFLREDIKEKILNFKLDIKEKALLARDFIGAKFLTKRLKKSFSLLLKEKTAGIPQISEVSFLRSAVLTLVTRKIILKHKIPSGRYLIKISDLKNFKFQ
ncbi:MAG: hypothetical protein KatS3mg095_0652 [Candidatus Parcubacteria bacterium]|nr:MAG: hypothetical protein KatS3mg095_0652 [Candidatus Parcubacteria bacterium]